MNKRVLIVVAVCLALVGLSKAREPDPVAKPGREMSALRAAMMSDEVRAARAELAAADKALKVATDAQPELKALDAQIKVIRERMMKLMRKRSALVPESEKKSPELKDQRDEARAKYRIEMMAARKKAMKPQVSEE